MNVDQTDHTKLVARLRQIAPSVQKSFDRAWRRDAALRVIDCVLSLNRSYDSFVVPRLDRFERMHPEVRSIADLQSLMAAYPSSAVFVAKRLGYNDDSRSATLAKVVDWMVKIADSGDYDTQMSNLEHWAVNAKPEDHFRLGIAGFGVGGFQYLRMLFGADTTKPDIYIRQFVAECVGHSVSDIKAVQLLESAAHEAGIRVRDLDTTVWEGSARSKTVQRKPCSSRN